MIDKKDRLIQILSENRMSKGLDIPGNSLKGVYNLIQKYVKEDYSITEIGSYEGSTAELWLLTMQHGNNGGKSPFLTCIDPWGDGNNFDQETYEELYDAEIKFDERMLPYRKERYPFKKLKMKSSLAHELIGFESQDLIYIDGDHRPESLLADIMLYAPKVKPMGYIAGHDYYLEIKHVVKMLYGEPDETFEDGSWIVSKKRHSEIMAIQAGNE